MHDDDHRPAGFLMLHLNLSRLFWAVLVVLVVTGTCALIARDVESPCPKRTPEAVK